MLPFSSSTAPPSRVEIHESSFIGPRPLALPALRRPFVASSDGPFGTTFSTRLPTCGLSAIRSESALACKCRQVMASQALEAPPSATPIHGHGQEHFDHPEMRVLPLVHRGGMVQAMRLVLFVSVVGGAACCRSAMDCSLGGTSGCRDSTSQNQEEPLREDERR